MQLEQQTTKAYSDTKNVGLSTVISLAKSVAYLNLLLLVLSMLGILLKTLLLPQL